MPDTDQQQTQSQNQTVSITVRSAGDVELENRIFRDVHSAGRQLSRMAAVIEVMLTALERDSSFGTNPQDRESITNFRRMQAQIGLEKDVRDPERLITALQNLRAFEPQTFDSVKQRLRAFLDSDA